MPQLKLFVGGMSCRHCVRDVTARLRDVPGVETVSANPDDCTVRMSGSMRLDDVLAAFTGTSYRPRLDTATPSTSPDAGPSARGSAGGSADSGETGVGKRKP